MAAGRPVKAAGDASKSLSARHALTEKEMRFCIVHKAGVAQTEAYRRSHFPAEKGWLDHNEKEVEEDRKAGIRKMPNPKEVARRATMLIREPHIQSFLEELDAQPLDRAREILHEQALTATGAEARHVASKIIESANQLGVASASERYAEILCAISANVCVPVPGPDAPIHIPAKEMFPRYAEALPPPEVLRKTIASLQEYLEKVESPENV